MYYGARYYLPSLRRFISADTVVPGAGIPQAFNRYAYVLNSPLSFIDPSGNVSCQYLEPEAAAYATCTSNSSKGKTIPPNDQLNSKNSGTGANSGNNNDSNNDNGGTSPFGGFGGIMDLGGFLGESPVENGGNDEPRLPEEPETAEVLQLDEDANQQHQCEPIQLNPGDSLPSNPYDPDDPCSVDWTRDYVYQFQARSGNFLNAPRGGVVGDASGLSIAVASRCDFDPSICLSWAFSRNATSTDLYRETTITQLLDNGFSVTIDGGYATPNLAHASVLYADPDTPRNSIGVQTWNDQIRFDFTIVWSPPMLVE